MDLNGKTVTNAESRIYQATDANAVLSITDLSASQNGTIRATKIGDNNEGGIFMILGGGTMNIYRGTLDASATSRAGDTQGNAVWMSGSESKFNMYGGSIVGNSNPGDYYGLNVHISEGTFTMSGGSIAGGMSRDYGNVLVEEAGKLDMTGGSIEGMSCICGMDADGKHFGNCDGKVLVWTAWPKDDSLPRTGGNYYLTKNISLSGQTGLDDSNQTINIDLNGHTVTAANSRMFISIGQSNLHLNITDLSAGKNGTMKCTHTGDGGSMFYITGATTISLYAGTLDASEAKDAVVLYNTSAFNMYGGALMGGSSERGSSVHLEDNASFKMTAGSISGGRATANGGNVCAPFGTTVTISGGSITGGTAGENGHNVFANGTLNLYGGTIGNTEMTSEANAKSETTLVIGGNATVSYKASNQ